MGRFSFKLVFIFLLFLSWFGFADPRSELVVRLVQQGIADAEVNSILNLLPDYNEMVHREEELKSVFLQIHDSMSDTITEESKTITLSRIDQGLLFRMSGLLYQVNLEKEIFWTGLVYELTRLRISRISSLSPVAMQKWAKLQDTYLLFQKAASAGHKDEFKFFEANGAAKEYGPSRDSAQLAMNDFNSKHRSVFFEARDLLKTLEKKSITSRGKELSAAAVKSVWEAWVFRKIVNNGPYMSIIGRALVNKLKKQGIEFDLSIENGTLVPNENEFQIVLSRHGTGQESAVMAAFLMDNATRKKWRMLLAWLLKLRFFTKSDAPKKAALLFSPFRFVSGVTSDRNRGRRIAQAMEDHVLTVSVHKEHSPFKDEDPSPSIRSQIEKILANNARTLVVFPEGRLSPMFGSISSIGPGSFKFLRIVSAFAKGMSVRVQIVAPVLPNAGYDFVTRTGSAKVQLAKIDSEEFLQIAKSNPSHAASLMEFLLAHGDYQDSSARVFGSPSPNVILESVLGEFASSVPEISCRHAF